MFSSKDFEKLWFLRPDGSKRASSSAFTRQRESLRRSPLIHSVKRMVYPMKSLTSGFAIHDTKRTEDFP